jgi:hypothetical protein
MGRLQEETTELHVSMVQSDHWSHGESMLQFKIWNLPELSFTPTFHAEVQVLKQILKMS